MSEDRGTEIFVRNLKKFMHDKDVTQDDVSKALNVHQTTVSAPIIQPNVPPGAVVRDGQSKTIRA